MSDMDVLEKQLCAYCKTKNLTLMQREFDIPYFGKVFVYSMTCTHCKFHKADVECVDNKGPVKYTLDVSDEKDLSARIVKSSEATIKIPYVGDIEPGLASQGYVSNVEGVLRRMKRQIESFRDSAEDQADKKKAKNLLKKLQKVLFGRDKIKIILIDPTGNSAIVSEKAVKSTK